MFARSTQLWADAVHGVPLTLGGSPWWPPLPLSAATAVPVATAAAANPIPTIAANRRNRPVVPVIRSPSPWIRSRNERAGEQVTVAR